MVHPAIPVDFTQVPNEINVFRATSWASGGKVARWHGGTVAVGQSSGHPKIEWFDKHDKQKSSRVLNECE